MTAFAEGHRANTHRDCVQAGERRQHLCCTRGKKRTECHGGCGNKKWLTGTLKLKHQPCNNRNFETTENSKQVRQIARKPKSATLKKYFLGTLARPPCLRQKKRKAGGRRYRRQGGFLQLAQIDIPRNIKGERGIGEEGSTLHSKLHISSSVFLPLLDLQPWRTGGDRGSPSRSTPVRREIWLQVPS